MKIAIWNYGDFGRRIAGSLKYYWDDRFTLTAIYDSKYVGKYDRAWDMKVSDPARIKEDHDSGLFEKIIVCIIDPTGRQEVVADLNALGIQEFYPGDSEDFVSLDEFGAEKIHQDENCNIYKCRDVMVARADHLSWECTYIFDNEGRIFADPWNVNDWYDSEVPLIYPFKLKDPTPQKIMMPGSYCLLTKIFSNNYWHFTFQDLCDAYCLEKAGFTGTYVISNASYIRELMIMLGIAPERIMSIDELEFQKIYVFEEIYSVQIDHRNTAKEARVVAETARLIRGRLKRDPSYPRFIYIKRVGSRKLINGDEIAEKFGFVTVIPENLSVKEQMEYFYNADIVMTPHGANSTNCLYMHENSVFIEIFSDRWQMDLNSGVCRENHIFHMKAKGKAEGVAKLGMHDDYSIAPNRVYPVLKRAFDLVQDPPPWPEDALLDIERIDLKAVYQQSDGILIYGAKILGEQACNMAGSIFSEKLLGFAVTSMENNPQEKNGYPVHSIDEWVSILADKKISPAGIGVIMALNPLYYDEILERLENDGFKNIFTREELEWYCGHEKTEKRYQTGLLMGVFDMFHIGHLNLIRRAKERCSYLRVGVLSDKLANEFKSRYPVIPQNERMAILAALRDVDEVVLIETKDDVYRPNEWRKRPFDCFFSGDDYADNESWKKEKEELKKLGADMEFFSYTKERSTTMIREEIKKRKRS